MAENPAITYLMTGPSISPENWFKNSMMDRNGEAFMMPTCDRELVWWDLYFCIQAADILGIDKASGDNLQTVLGKLLLYNWCVNEPSASGFKDYEEAPGTIVILALIGFISFLYKILRNKGSSSP